MLKKLIIIMISIVSLYGQSNETYLNIDSTQDTQTIVLTHNTYKILIFQKRLQDIRLSSSDILSVNFEDGNTPLSQIKAFAKGTGLVNMLIKFSDNTTKQINFKIIQDIREVRSLIKTIASDVELLQINDSIILKGKVQTNKIKDKILLILKESLSSSKIVNLLKVIEPDKMVRLKLYVAQIDNDKGELLKNNWSFGGSETSGTTTNTASVTMLNAVTLSGGLGVMANTLGSKFNAGLTLNYIKKNNVGRILDETELITLENQSSDFLAGGTIRIKTSSTSADGQPISGVEKIEHGLTMSITVKEIINDKYVHIEIDTGLSDPDWINTVDNIPSMKNKTIKTNIIVENQSTIVLGGLKKTNKTENIEKIPLLGDIPLVGFLFRSKEFIDDKNELVFFITPTIIGSDTPTQEKLLNSTKKRVLVKHKNIKENSKSIEIHKHNKKINEMFGIN